MPRGAAASRHQDRGNESEDILTALVPRDDPDPHDRPVMLGCRGPGLDHLPFRLDQVSRLDRTGPAELVGAETDGGPQAGWSPPSPGSTSRAHPSRCPAASPHCSSATRTTWGSWPSRRDLPAADTSSSAMPRDFHGPFRITAGNCGKVETFPFRPPGAVVGVSGSYHGERVSGGGCRPHFRAASSTSRMRELPWSQGVSDSRVVSVPR